MTLWMTLVKLQDGRMTGRNQVAETWEEAVELYKKNVAGITAYYDVVKQEWIKV